MDERDIKEFYKRKKANEIIVNRAESLEHEIRFYFNSEQYVAAFEKTNVETVFIRFDEDKEEKSEKEIQILKKIRKKEGLLLRVFSVLMGVLNIVSTIMNRGGFLRLNLYIICMICVLMLVQIIAVVRCEEEFLPESIKSKHTAEHMIINFIQKNRRLPRNTQEYKRASRFNDDCGSIKKIRYEINEFLQNMITIIIVLLIEIFVIKIQQVIKLSSSIDYDYVYVYVYVYAYIYMTVFYVVRKMLKDNRFKVIRRKTEIIINKIIQCSNTTKNVKERDLELAYCAAEQWMKIVYHEYYEENDNIFNKVES